MAGSQGQESRHSFHRLLVREVLGRRKTAGVELPVQKEGDEAATLRGKREAALYVDWKEGIQTPKAAIAEDDAREAIEVANRLAGVATDMTKEYEGLTPDKAREQIALAVKGRKA